MKFALCGSHGTGKTTVWSALAARRPAWYFLSEATRWLVPLVGYNSPWEIVEEFGVAYYETMLLSQWSVIDTGVNEEEGRVPCVLDRSPIDNLAYYLVYRSTAEERYEKILVALAKHYASMITWHYYFPIARFQVVADGMRRTDGQREVAECIQKLLKDFRARVSVVEPVARAERVDYILSDIESRLRLE